ncbi:four-carbon acid sugar kinase family protein [Sinomonas sp. ASV322]|uniref:four-carbon acid sugar kinase family protein n=1 Tax=Sinomonas sp. ASV322 TaxID=3041920 RepID=UPI0027DC9C46|nr:four-carbon acid sugar kinase family protein [Sinomonas sp. ASV322]MDQ4500859.1 four-carbon acid sugar kinase family protein [Sinomonas sp. ASV322]
MLLEADALAPYPAESLIPAAAVASAVARSGRVLVVLDDDPTGTQSVADLPVLTSWEVDDFRWAFGVELSGSRASAVYVLTNTRSLDPDEAARRNREVVGAALEAAAESGTEIAFVSRSDSTLRGHFPLETDVISEALAEHGTADGGRGAVDGIVIVPAFPDAGRVTIGGEHYMRTSGPDGAAALTRVSETEFARDASFGFSTSYLPAYVEEKSAGRLASSDVIVLDLGTIRAGAEAIADAIAPAESSTPIVADIVAESDFRALALGLEAAEGRGKKLLYRVGPPFVRGRIGQEERKPLTADEIFHGQDRALGGAAAGGLIVVGSHVGQTTRQLARLTEQHSSSRIVELDVEHLLDPPRAEAYLDARVAVVIEALAAGDVIVHTSRTLVRSDDPAESLRIARTVSAAVVRLVNRVLTTTPPRFVIAKGGITSSDVAAHGLEIRRAIVRGPMLPGIVSLWEPVDGPARGIPYVVFAGNVGDDESLADVTRTLSRTF